jgi:hypothetical protein
MRMTWWLYPGLRDTVRVKPDPRDSEAHLQLVASSEDGTGSPDWVNAATLVASYDEVSPTRGQTGPGCSDNNV